MINNDLFYPIRYEKSRPFLEKMLLQYHNKSDQEIFSEPFIMKVQNLLFDEMVECERKYPPPFVLTEQDFNNKLSRELNFFAFYQKWLTSGKNIFHFSKELLTLFENTDVGEVPFDIIKYPFKSFYLSFADLDYNYGIDTIGDKYFIDGVLIVKDFVKENQIDFFFNGFVKGAKPTKEWLFGNYGSIIGDWYRVNYSPQKNDLNKCGYLAKFLSDNPNGRPAEDASAFFFDEMIKLAINALCYISTKQETPLTELLKDTSLNLFVKHNSVKSKHKKEVFQSDLKLKGYSHVSFYGQTYKKSENSTSIVGKNIAVHWRRGHWRNQPFGQNLSEKKIVWIKPTIVNKDNGEPEKGRIYGV